MHDQKIFYWMPISAGKGWEAMGRMLFLLATTLLSLPNPRGGNAKALDEAGVAKA